jgi:hypothetical protein
VNNPSDEYAALLSINEELKAVLARVKRLEGILSICMFCKKIKTQSNEWDPLEKYLTENTDAMLSHGVCQECFAIENEKIGTPD